MFFRQLLNEDLGCASYVIADAGEAVVVDPQWAIDDYLALARLHGLEIAQIVETHVHADHVSGGRRLADATGALLAVPEGADAESADRLLTAGESIQVGDVRLALIATPGHRPEHSSLLVAERPDAAPALLLSGDSLLVGEVARPDLAHGDELAVEAAARSLFRSLRRLLELDDSVELWPGHLGGSLCGGGRLSPRPSSTIGYERRTNPMLAIESEDLFVRRVLASLPARPPRVQRTVALNRRPRGDAHGSEPAALDAAQVRRLMTRGATLVDGRDPDDFEHAHVPGSLNVSSSRPGFGTRCASLADPDTDTVVLGRDNRDARYMTAMLQAVGFTRVHGVLKDGLAGWSRGGPDFAFARARSVEPEEAAALLACGSGTILDVRDPEEWERERVPGSLHVQLAQLPERLGEARGVDGPLVVACASGARAASAASLLRAAGLVDVVRLRRGGVLDLARHGVALERGVPATSTARPIRGASPVVVAADRRRTAAR